VLREQSRSSLGKGKNEKETSKGKAEKKRSEERARKEKIKKRVCLFLDHIRIAGGRPRATKNSKSGGTSGERSLFWLSDRRSSTCHGLERYRLRRTDEIQFHAIRRKKAVKRRALKRFLADP